MKKTISEKQLRANQQNAKKGGVRTLEGKEISKCNAFKHGILSEIITEYDKVDFDKLLKRLKEEYCPESLIEEILVEKIAVYIIRLYRAAKAETEYMKKVLNPEIGHHEGLFDVDWGKWVVDKPGYKPKITDKDFEPLERLYLRYEKTLENRLFRILHELERIQRIRRGELVPPPLSIDISSDSVKE